ncbi:MAG: hypothetical protein HUU55_18100 [Myxococcales bacterium]|nr:hypothetical protein [Myxococcales bacterium]
MKLSRNTLIFLLGLWGSSVGMTLNACGGDGGNSTPIIPGTDTTEDAQSDTGTADDTGQDKDAGNGNDGDQPEDITDPDDQAQPQDTGDGGGEGDVGDINDSGETDSGSDGCKSNAECNGQVSTNACETAVCNTETGICEAQPNTTPDCCIVVADCDDGNDATIDSCPTPGNSCIHTPDSSVCPDNIVFLNSDFDDSTKQGWTVKEFDNDPLVTWTTSQKRSTSGAYSFYFGRTDGCPTYYSGTLAPGCTLPPEGEDSSTPQFGSLLTPELSLPTNKIILLSLDVWADMEMVQDPKAPLCKDKPNADPCYDPELEELFDNVFLYVNYTEFDKSGELVAKKDKLWTTVALTKSTSGEFRTIAADLSQYAGKAIKIELAAQTDENFNFDFEGFYVDSIRVATGCGKILDCTDSGPCASPNPCVVAECTPFVNTSSGACLGLKAPGCVPCVSGNDSECDDGDDCTVNTCVEQKCQSKPASSCCEDATVAGVFDFESGGLPSGWAQTSTSDTVKWQIASSSPKSGNSHLYFGNAATGTYEDGSNAVSGSLSTDTFVLPSGVGDLMLGLSLRLSTEWNLGKVDPAFSFDRFTIEAIYPDTSGEKVELLFDSLKFNGSTGDNDGGEPIYKNLALSLTKLAGKEIRLRLKFETGDGQNNDFGGVFVDDLGIFTVCGLPTKPCQIDDGCADKSVCTVDSCQLGTCKNIKENPKCCTANSECNDANSCTNDSCVEGVCQNVDKGDPNCCNPASATTWNFEASSPEWSLTSANQSVGWSFATGDAYQGDGYLYFGNPATGTFEVDNNLPAYGEATAPVWNVPTGGTTALTFWLNLATEFDEDPFVPVPFPIDRLTVAVLDDKGAKTPIWISDNIGGTTNGQWQKIQIGLKGFAGKAIQVVFEFDSGDQFANNYGGVKIDDLGYQVVCGANIQCFAPSDCTDDGNACTIATCIANKCGVENVDSAECCTVKNVVSASFDSGATGNLDGFVVTPLSCPELTNGDGATVCNVDATTPVKWQVNDAQSKSPKFSLYFGNPANKTFADGISATAGMATSAKGSLYVGKSAKLEMWVYLDVEPYSADFTGIDMFEAVIVDQSGVEHVIWDKSKLPANGMKTWQNIKADLSAFNGQSIQIKVYFDSYDGQVNSGQGVFVDDVKIIQECGNL